MKRAAKEATKPALVTAASDDGSLVTQLRNPYPDLTAGDLAYLDQSRLHEVQIRPLLGNEHPPGSRDDYPTGVMWLVWTSRTGVQLRGLVKMPAARRKNIKSNVALAIQRVGEFSQAHGALFALADAGVDPFYNQES